MKESVIHALCINAYSQCGTFFFLKVSRVDQIRRTLTFQINDTAILTQSPRSPPAKNVQNYRTDPSFSTSSLFLTSFCASGGPRTRFKISTAGVRPFVAARRGRRLPLAGSLILRCRAQFFVLGWCVCPSVAMAQRCPEPRAHCTTAQRRNASPAPSLLHERCPLLPVPGAVGRGPLGRCVPGPENCGGQPSAAPP